MSNSSESTGEGVREASTSLPYFDAWDPIDAMCRCISCSPAEQDTAAVTPLDQRPAEREVPPEEGEASARPAGESMPQGDLHCIVPGSIPQWLIDELVVRIEARLLPRFRQLLDVELVARMREAIRAEVKTFSIPPIEP